MPYDVSLRNLLPFKDDLRISLRKEIFIVNMNFHDSKSSFCKK